VLPEPAAKTLPEIRPADPWAWAFEEKLIQIKTKM
jgi:hypothetical protein